MKPIKMILDTDIGDDIDDAFALAFAINHKDIELLGVTTVFKDTISRAHQVSKYLRTIHQTHIQISAGIGKPIQEPIRYFDRDKVDVDGHVYPPQYDSSYVTYPFNRQHATDFIYEKALEHSGELIIVPIGPLTNIAMTIKKYPDITKHIKKIVLMGGWTTNPTPEWNILCDPEAADVVFRSGIDVYCVGLDVTLQCTVEKDLLDIIKTNQSEHGKLLSLWFERWIKHFNFEKSVMHDPLAVASLVSDVCVFEKKNIYVDLEQTRGSIKVDEDKGSELFVATQVDKELFYKLFKATIYGL